MSAIRTFAVVVVLLVGWAALPGAAPPRGPIAGWVEDLGSDDGDVRSAAIDNLWKAGRAAEPVLRAAMKHHDADVVLRARLVLSRFDWGIYPDTPAAVVKAIELYRDGNVAQRKTAVEELIKQGRPGFLTLKQLLARETNAAARKQIGDYLKREYRTLVREMIAAGDQAGAELLLEMARDDWNLDVMRDLACFWALTGQTATKAKEFERKALAGDGDAGNFCTYLHRANGDLAAANKMASRSGDGHLLANILDEQQDYKEMVRVLPANHGFTLAQLATLKYHAGDREGFEAALSGVPATKSIIRSEALFCTDHPRRAINLERQAGNLANVCKLLALQGRRHEALALVVDSTTEDPHQGARLLLEQAVVTQQMGEKEQARKLLDQAFTSIEKAGWNDFLMAEMLRAGIRVGQRKRVLDDLAKALDLARTTTTPRSLLTAMTARDGETLILWWDYLRRKTPDAVPSAILARLRGWFEQGKPDKDFDALIEEVARSKTLPAAEQARWPTALARTCEVVKKSKKAEELLRAAATAEVEGAALPAGNKLPAAVLRLADFYFALKQWKEAAAEYGRALKIQPTNVESMYLRGVALGKSGNIKEGATLRERARLLPLADEQARFTLGDVLTRHGLEDEAGKEWVTLMRTATFRSVYSTNAASRTAWLLSKKKPLEAARYYRRTYMNLALGRGSFIDPTANLRVPAWAHQYQTRGLLAEDKLDAALAEGKLVLEYLPEEIGVVIDLVRALDRAKRKSNADRLFDSIFPRLQRACQGAAKSTNCHNRLAWLSVRCNRQLDRALKHARIATSLSPESAVCQDTLAEVYFQRGNRSKAIDAMKKAMNLDPKNAYFAAALKRIESGDRKSDLPEQ